MTNEARRSWVQTAIICAVIGSCTNHYPTAIGFVLMVVVITLFSPEENAAPKGEKKPSPEGGDGKDA